MGRIESAMICEQTLSTRIWEGLKISTLAASNEAQPGPWEGFSFLLLGPSTRGRFVRTLSRNAEQDEKDMDM